jgi:hypothetical protein
MTKFIKAVPLLISLFMLLYVAGQKVYMAGFDGGAAASQCLNDHVKYGGPQAMKLDACQDTARYQKSLAFKAFGFRTDGK